MYLVRVYVYLLLQTRCNPNITVTVIGFYDYLKQAIDYHIIKTLKTRILTITILPNHENTDCNDYHITKPSKHGF